MPRTAKTGSPEELLSRLRDLLNNFDRYLHQDDLRLQVKKLVPVNHLLRDLGCSLLKDDCVKSAQSRILQYLRLYQGLVIAGDELMVVAGISEYARRIRELRVQMGWKILSGVTAKEMREDAEAEGADASHLPKMKPNQYLLISPEQDRDAAHRWQIANRIRKGKEAVRDKILQYFRENVGMQVSGEELRYVANNKTEWARRTRELRTEFGWPIITKFTGRPDLPVGIYVLEEDRQAPEHDRKIPDDVRRAVLVRDRYACTDCGWTHEQWNPSDPRHLEAHHVHEHAKGGKNTAENLITLCNVCHDKAHRK